MTCLLTWMSVCLVDPANLYASAGLYPNNAHPSNYEGAWCWDHWCRGPIGEVKLGLVVELNGTLDLDVGVLHRSFPLEPYDEGTNGAYAVLTWRPWR